MGISSYIVPPSRIQEELDTLWNAQENKNKVRASLFNIIFFTKQSSRDDYVRKISSKLIEKFPARIFFISFDASSSENSLKTAVSVISTEQGEYSITCDLIEIFAKGDDGKQVPFLLLPHIIPDLPVFLVWEEDPSIENPLCNELKTFATRIIFDSESTEDLCRFSKAVMKIQNSINCEIADLNWARLESWRDLLSTTFSDSQKIEQLQNTQSMTITYNAQETPSFCHTKIQSIYLQTWIAARMNWSPDKKRSSLDLCRFFYETQGRGIEIELQGIKNGKLPPGMILSVEIKTIEEEHFSFMRDPEAPHQISFIYSTKSECALPTKFLVSKGESGQSLIKEICHKGTSTHYQEVLQKISDWNRGGAC
jgi:glucose-6-phosphate dehydrogenase assembly protein OpcA